MHIDLAFLRSVRKSAQNGLRRVLVINGHPDPGPDRFCAALCDAFTKGARASGHWTRRLELGYENTLTERESSFERLWWSDRLFVVYPLWHEGPPARLRHLFEEFAHQRARAEFAARANDAQVIITASLPSLLYRGRAGGSLSGMRHLVGLEEAPTTVIGSIDAISKSDRERWLFEMRQRGGQKD